MEWMRGTVVGAAAALAIAGFGAGADASSVLSQTEGSIFATPASDMDTGTGLTPVASSAAYERPPELNDGAIHMAASAAVGSLGASADLSITDAPGTLSSPYYTTAQAQGYATFQDRWTFSDRPLDTAGTLRVTLHFAGTASANATGATPNGSGRFTFDITSLEAFDNPHATQNYDSGIVQVANDDAVLELSFLYGRPVIVNGSLVARVRLDSLPDAYSYSGGGAADFTQGAEITSLEVQDAVGQWSTSFTLTTESGGQYPIPTPEPSEVAETAAAVVALATCRAQARPSRAS